MDVICVPDLLQLLGILEICFQCINLSLMTLDEAWMCWINPIIELGF